jgi:hypothetical protein
MSPTRGAQKRTMLWGRGIGSLVLALAGLIISGSIIVSYFSSKPEYGTPAEQRVLSGVPAGWPSNLDSAPAETVFLVIAVGSAPQRLENRKVHRDNFENYRNSPGSERIATAFFTERTEETELESKTYGDVLFNRGKSGYTDFAARGEQHLEWALKTFNFDYYLRLDDDGVLCLDRLVYQLKRVHLEPPQTSMLFWGKYHCHQHISRADENFMLFSHALAVYTHVYLSHMKTSGSTFALNVGAFLIQMKDVIIIDDRAQIDSQQGYVTNYMRFPFDESLLEKYRGFCSDHVWAHHVPVEVMRASMEGRKQGVVDGDLPNFKPPNETCGERYSYDVQKFLKKAGVPL